MVTKHMGSVGSGVVGVNVKFALCCEGLGRVDRERTLKKSTQPKTSREMICRTIQFEEGPNCKNKELVDGKSTSRGSHVK